MDQTSLAAQIAEIARTLEHQVGTQETVDVVGELAVETVPNAEDAGITVVHRTQGVETQAATSGRGLTIDQLQYDLGQGPCLAAVWEVELVSVPDIATDDRWPEWAARAVRDTDIRSMLCFRLFTIGRRLGAMNLYASRPNVFTDDDVEAGTLLSVHAAIAIAGAQELTNAEAGLDTRTTIGQAQGILIERYGVDPIRAFAVLRRISSHTNRKLYDIALELVQTGALPKDPAGSTETA